MNKINMMFALMAILSILTGCDLQYTADSAKTSAATAAPTPTPTPLICNPNNQFCNKVQGQIFYSSSELMAAPITNGSLNLKYNLQDFQVFFLGQNHAYSTTTDSKGNFHFSNVEPGEYTLIARYVPSNSSDIFYDCTWVTSLAGTNSNGQATGETSICKILDQSEAPYKIGSFQENIEVVDQKISSISLENVQKFYMDKSGYISQTQTILPSSSTPAPTQNWNGPALNIGGSSN